MGVCRLPLLLLLASFAVYGQEEADSAASTLLKEVIVEGSGGAPVRISSNGNVRVDAGSISRGLRVLGEADLLGALKRTGGVSTIGDYGSGIVIQGNTPSQSIYRIDGAPVFFPYRFGGVFSTFNTSHFASLNVVRHNRGASAPSRLGAVIDLTPALQFDKALAGNVNVGLLASTLTLKTSAAGRFALTASGRTSYIDEVYGRFLNTETNTTRYRFSDVNISAAWQVDSLNRLSANLLYTTDRLAAGNVNYAMTTRLNWRNTLASLAWSHAGPRKASLRAWYSEFVSGLTVGMPQFDVDAHASIRSAAVSGDVMLTRARGFIPEVTAGAEAGFYRSVPLWARLTGEVTQPTAPSRRQDNAELRLFADARFMPVRTLTFAVGLSASTFSLREWAVDPRLSVELRQGGNTWTLGAGLFSQYLHLVGFSEIGLASNFWYASSGAVKPQRSLDFTAGWARGFMNEDLVLSASVYYKIVKSQPEYAGQVLDIINFDYRPDGHIFMTDGYNVGGDISLRKDYGALTGAVTYAFGRAMRHLPGSDAMFPSLTDMGHQLKADAEYRFNDHWSVAAAFVYASGRVYTPTRYLYLIANRLIAEYAGRNSGRMPSYQRLDLSGTYRFRTGGRVPLTHMVNLSLINAYGHRNVESQYFAIDAEGLNYKLYRVASLYRFLPSISYSMEF